jgi:hypothetical protein
LGKRYKRTSTSFSFSLPTLQAADIMDLFEAWKKEGERAGFLG